MALIFENQSKCPVCNLVLDNSRPYTMFPPFMGNKKDPMFTFSDNGVHNDCLNKHPFGEMALLYRDKYDEDIRVLRLKTIEDRKNSIPFGLLTSDSKENLSKFNFLTLSKDDLKNWEQKDEFINVATKFNREGKWEGLAEFNYLDYLINEVTRAFANSMKE